jgi:hypothetical protein
MGKNLTFGGIINDVNNRMKVWKPEQWFEEGYEKAKFKIFERKMFRHSKQFYLYMIGQEVNQSGYW